VAAELVFEIDGVAHRHAIVKQETTMGRGTDNDIVVHDDSVSRHHAKIVRESGGYRVVDLGSRNGTHLADGQGLDGFLSDGDVVVLGRFPLTFEATATRKISLVKGPESVVDEASGTVFRQALDFSALAGAAPAARRDPAAEVDRLRKLLSILTQVSASLLASKPLDDMLAYVLDVVFEHLPAERGSIMLWDEKRSTLVERAVKVRDATKKGSDIHVSRTIAERVCRDKVAVLTMDAQVDPRFAGGASIMTGGIRSAMAAPLWHGERVEGLIYVDTPLQVKAFDDADMDLLSALGNHAAIAIEQARLQESVLSERLSRQRLERYHSPAVIERIARAGGAAEMAADERDVTIMFADVVGFTSRCEHMEPKQVAEFLNRCFSRMADMIFKHEGTLDKFIGDCVMAVFGAPFPMADHAVRAVSAAVDIRAAIAELNEELPEGERVQFRMGLNSGKVVAGDIGSVRRRDYTVLGATVNLASRLESSVAKPGQIVVSDVTNGAVRHLFETRLVGQAQPKGISRVVDCFEVVRRKS
jgi:adenylate cyclase